MFYNKLIFPTIFFNYLSLIDVIGSLLLLAVERLDLLYGVACELHGEGHHRELVVLVDIGLGDLCDSVKGLLHVADKVNHDEIAHFAVLLHQRLNDHLVQGTGEIKHFIAAGTYLLALWKAHGNGKPSGFIPPIWFGNKYLKEQALEIFDYYEDFHGIYQKVKGNIKKTNSATLSFSILPTPILGIAQTYACLRMLLPGGVHRLVFHDKDFRTIGEKRILNMVRYISTLREKIMYKDL